MSRVVNNKVAREWKYVLVSMSYFTRIPVGTIPDFVTLDQGSGIVHVAPGHGSDDYNLGIKNNIEVVQTVTDDGKYNENAKTFAWKILVSRAFF